MTIDYIREKSDGSFMGGPFADGEFYINFSKQSPLWREVEEWLAAGNALEAYVAPSPIIPPIPRLDFWLAVSEADIGVTKAGVKARIDAMPDGKEKEQALYYFEDAERYRREDPLLNQMAALEGISPAELDHLWAWALASYARRTN